jgi:hypothetical protein
LRAKEVRGCVLHITQSLEGLEPLEDRRVGPPGGLPARPPVSGLDPADGFPLGFEIDRRIAIGGLDAGATKPVADGYEIDTGLEKMDGRAVAHAVRVQALGCERRQSEASTVTVLGQDVAGAVASKLLPAVVEKERLLRT